MADLTSTALCRKAFYRLVATTSADAALVENSESVDDVADLHLNNGFRAGQRFLVGSGLTNRWRKRGSAITWSGADATDGGKYVALPSDFLMLSRRPPRSSLVEADGSEWGQEIPAEQDDKTGDWYYLKNDQLWRTVDSSPPSTLYLDYVFLHPEFTGSITLDFPLAVRGLAVAYAGHYALADGWFGADPEKIRLNLQFWQEQGRLFAQRSRGPRMKTPPRVIGHYFA